MVGGLQGRRLFPINNLRSFKVKFLFMTSFVPWNNWMYVCSLFCTYIDLHRNGIIWRNRPIIMTLLYKWVAAKRGFKSLRKRGSLFAKLIIFLKCVWHIQHWFFFAFISNNLRFNLHCKNVDRFVMDMTCTLSYKLKLNRYYDIGTWYVSTYFLRKVEQDVGRLFLLFRKTITLKLAVKCYSNFEHNF